MLSLPRTQGFEVIRFIETCCIHPDGRWLGTPLLLQPWQKRLLLELFRLRSDGLRQYRWAYISVPKKSGKSSVAAALALYLLIADGEPAPLIVCAAAAEDQADLVFGYAKRMCELSPPLRQITEGGRFASEILVPGCEGAKLKRVAANAGLSDGLNLHACMLDELHEWMQPKHRATWDILTNGTVARRQPLVLQITTAGYDEDTVCYEQYEYGQRVARGEVDDPSYFHWVREAPEQADYRDPEVWRSANPNYGITVTEEGLRDQLGKKTEAVFRRYFLNQWTRTAQAWLPHGAWDACEDRSLELDPQQPLHVGIDMAYSNDCAAIVGAQRQGDRTVVRLLGVWENPYPATHSEYSHWKINPFEVEERCKEFRQRFPSSASELDGEVRPGPEYCYDPAWFSRSAPILAGEGLAMLVFPQTDSRMIPAAQTLYQLVTEGKLAHDGNPTLKRHVSNAVADQKPRGWRLTKLNAKHKIDAAIACAIAVHQAQVPSPGERISIYETRGLLVL